MVVKDAMKPTKRPDQPGWDDWVYVCQAAVDRRNEVIRDRREPHADFVTRFLTRVSLLLDHFQGTDPEENDDPVGVAWDLVYDSTDQVKELTFDERRKAFALLNRNLDKAVELANEMYGERHGGDE